MASDALKNKVAELLRREFSGPRDEVNVFDGYQENVHVLVAAERFKGMPEYMRDDQIWHVLDEGLSDAEKVLVSLILPFDIDEPEYRWALDERDQKAAGI